ncbi:MAG: sulfurtransferase complex subunit TusB [Deltaproteobacteria bacterium]|nr:sulfurtransferase complex subunit TusB [Deltaproteobacteria bacterium]
MLHIVKRSPYESSALNDSLKYIREKDILLLTEDGIYSAKKGGKFENLIKGVLQNNKVFCLVADVKARGISESELIENVSLIDYKGFVEKVCDHNPVTWG